MKSLAVLEALRELQRFRRGPVPGPLVADFAGLPERTARYHLAKMERFGLVQRPAGPRAGWMARRSLII